jgi:hypothetical protein
MKANETKLWLLSQGLSDQAINPSIRLSTECLGMRSEIKGIEAAEPTNSCS